MDPLVQSTNDSSILSKYSMVRHGYFNDDAIQHFVENGCRRSPLIHLGYFARNLVMDRCVTLYVESISEKNPQILSLGAGFDTTFFRLNSRYPKISYFEIDLQDVVRKKISSIFKSKFLASNLQNEFETDEENYLKSPNYTIFVHDLSVVEGLENKLLQMGFDFGQPTLIFSECAVTYIDEDKSTNLIRWFAEKMKKSVIMNYEQFNPDDGFGRVMTSHFDKIQSPLKSLVKFKTLDDQRKRYFSAGWSHCHVYCVMDLLHAFLSDEEFVKIFIIEPFDEWEEFHLKCCHYSLAVATQGVKESTFLTADIGTASLITSSHSKRASVVLLDIPVERYGHSSVRLNDNTTLIIGGFGIVSDNRHGRCKDALLVGESVKIVHQPNVGSTWVSMYHSSTLTGPNEFILFGGRTSPTKEVNYVPSMGKFTIQDGIVRLSIEEMSLNGAPGPSPRWRHSATSFSDGSMLIYGGRNSNLEVMNDLWELKAGDKGKWEWFERTSDSERPCGRFAHAMTSGGGAVYISGGLSSKLTLLNDIWELKIVQEDAVWKKLKPSIEIKPLYSHKMHWWRGKIFLLGGVHALPSPQPELTIIDLQTLEVTNYTLQLPNDGPIIMLHNFSSELAADEPALYCYGGGGNCFSFGTHLNRKTVKIPLEDFI